MGGIEFDILLWYLNCGMLCILYFYCGFWLVEVMCFLYGVLWNVYFFWGNVVDCVGFCEGVF